MHRVNEYGQPVGPVLPDWVPPAALMPTEYLDYCLLERLDPQRHAVALFAVYAQAQMTVTGRIYRPDHLRPKTTMPTGQPPLPTEIANVTMPSLIGLRCVRLGRWR